MSDPRHRSERSFVALCMQTTDTAIDLYWHDGLLRSRPSGTPPSVHIPVVADFVDRLARKLGSGEGALLTEAINRNASAHFVGGIPIGDSTESGAVDPYLRLYGQPGLHVMDGSVMPTNPGVNPSLTITALVERAISLWPNKGDADGRPPLGSGYERVDPVMPHRPVVKRRISIARVDDRLYAFDDLCTCADQACPLSGGLLAGTTIMCQCHGSRFDLATGAAINGPATAPLNRYDVREVEGSVQTRA